jgi:hypothetical protein
MTTDAILAELRTLPGAPESLRERVRALPEPQPRVRWTPPRIDVRRSLLVLAPALLAVAVGAAALHGVLSNGTQPTAQPAATLNAADAGVGGGAAHVERGAAVPAPEAKSLQLGTAATLPPSATRLNRYDAWLRIRVDDASLSNATTRAMNIARGYGGYVASVDMNTPGTRGSSSIVLRIPVTRVEDAVLRLGTLGAVTSQRVQIEDLQRQANALERRIEYLNATILKLEQKLADTTLTPAERLTLQYRLDAARRELAQKTKARAATVRAGTLATVSLDLFTPQPAAVPPHRRGRLDAAAHDAAAFLLRELSWLVYALIALGPIAVLAAVVVLGVRAGRRRSDNRLLEGA